MDRAARCHTRSICAESKECAVPQRQVVDIRSLGPVLRRVFPGARSVSDEPASPNRLLVVYRVDLGPATALAVARPRARRLTRERPGQATGHPAAQPGRRKTAHRIAMSAPRQTASAIAADAGTCCPPNMTAPLQALSGCKITAERTAIPPLNQPAQLTAAAAPPPRRRHGRGVTPTRLPRGDRPRCPDGPCRQLSPM
jgi:hypothetical protein